MKNKKGMTIYVDYDSVLNNMSHAWLKWLNYEYDKTYRIQDVDRWSWFSDMQKDKTTKVNPYDWLNKGIAFGGGNYECKPLEGSIDFFNLVSEEYNTVILTATTHKDNIPIKNDHISKYYQTTAVIHENDKWKYSVNEYAQPNVLIDDRLSNCLMFAAKGGYAILYNHNNEYEYSRMFRNMEGIFIATSYDEVTNILRVIND